MSRFKDWQVMEMMEMMEQRLSAKIRSNEARLEDRERALNRAENELHRAVFETTVAISDVLIEITRFRKAAQGDPSALDPQQAGEDDDGM